MNLAQNVTAFGQSINSLSKIGPSNKKIPICTFFCRKRLGDQDQSKTIGQIAFDLLFIYSFLSMSQFGLYSSIKNADKKVMDDLRL